MSTCKLENVSQFICDFGAEAVSLYVTMTGMPPETVPEYFLTSVIAERLFHQTKHYVGMETRVSELITWCPRPERPALEPSGRLRDVDIRRWKPDLVVYSCAVTPEDAELMALVEVKRGYISADLDENKRTDRSKALKILDQLDCDHVILCGSLPKPNRDFHIKKAEECRDRWFETSVTASPDNRYSDYYFGARLMTRPST